MAGLVNLPPGNLPELARQFEDALFALPEVMELDYSGRELQLIEQFNIEADALGFLRPYNFEICSGIVLTPHIDDDGRDTGDHWMSFLSYNKLSGEFDQFAWLKVGGPEEEICIRALTYVVQSARIIEGENQEEFPGAMVPPTVTQIPLTGCNAIMPV